MASVSPRKLACATPLDLVLWCALAVAWSSSYVVIKIGLDAVDPLVLVAGRVCVALVVIMTIFLTLGHRLSRRPADWLSYAATGLLGSLLPFTLITFGEQVVDSALAAIFMGLSPVATALLAAMVLPDERLTGRVVLGLAGAVIGVALLAGPSALLGLGRDIAGQAAILGAAVCYASSTVYIRRFVTRPPLEMAAGSSLVAAVLLVGAVLLGGGDGSGVVFSAASLGAILYLGLVSTAAANLTYFYLVPRMGAMRMSQVNFAVPVLGAVFGVGLLGEVLSLWQALAMVLIIGSVWLTTTRRR